MYEQFKQILVTSFRVPENDVTPEAKLDELELDSLDLVELALTVEQQLHVKLSDDELADLRSVDEVVRLLESRAARVV